MTDRAVPNLPSRDFGATIFFYGRLGFTQEYRDEGWLILPRRPHAGVLPFADLDPARAHSCAASAWTTSMLVPRHHGGGREEMPVGFPRVHPVTDAAVGLRIGNLIDLDGTQLNLIENPAPARAV